MAPRAACGKRVCHLLTLVNEALLGEALDASDLLGRR
jgi:hypothetical protein